MRCIAGESPIVCFPPSLPLKDTYPDKRETDRANEVETASSPAKAPEGAKPRTTRPRRPQKDTAMSYMGEH